MPRTTKVPIEDWEVCLQAAHPGYIGWEEFMDNQRRLENNINHYEAGHTGAPRKGAALLQGIAVCGRCGRRMSFRLAAPQETIPSTHAVLMAVTMEGRYARRCALCPSTHASKAFYLRL
ncbi:hypothetical protein QO004_002833 [Rhizobium mesoamericanum]|uniref:zinc ribbon domain-containing protein n=1 Tax=Rhizobium mesoamericanum TaxID=1079800 RepID=UPI002786C68B|nr:zinc ribbon domain-containing protein [Rhizobium mesoamericanum]MDQ0561040.1 hypothetical protein [Rhizobium mesoamericanum]